jgi:hypothetical protein
VAFSLSPTARYASPKLSKIAAASFGNISAFSLRISNASLFFPCWRSWPYQQAMRLPLQRGRFLNDRDDEHSPIVAVIDATFAKKYFPNVDPVGKRLNLALFDVQPEIIGVVGHVEHWGLGAKGHDTLQSQIYLAVWQVPDRFWPLLPAVPATWRAQRLLRSAW